jgi:shikimate kinase
MKLNKNLVFLGMMGSGKSSIGFLVSNKTKLKFIDIDNEIESKTQMKITEIFKKKGENFFRNLEEKITLRALKQDNAVISLGGGGFINEVIRDEVLSNHLSFWLNWDLNTLIYRIKNSKKRPLAYKVENLELKNLIKKRSKIYSKALFKIKCNKLTKFEIVDKIIKIYENNKT